MSVGQEYKSTKGQYNYRIETGTTYRGWELSMDIRKSKDNFKDRKLKCFNYEIYGHMAKDYKWPKKEKETRKCYKYRWVEHIAKNCRTKQKMKN